MYPEPIEALIEQFQKLPTIGRKSAQRLAFRIIDMDVDQVKAFSQALLDVKEKIGRCENCGNFSEHALCDICADGRRDESTICVVEDATNLYAFERSRTYHGSYHVLYGLISPLSDVSPNQINLERLQERVAAGGVKEVIVAISPTVEGETTSLYIANLLKPYNVAITRIASGIPFGGNVEYFDEMTLSRALEDRRRMS